MYPPKKRRSPFVHHLFAFAVIAFVVLFLFIWIAGSDDRSNEASDEVGETATKTVDLDAKTDDSKESKNSEPPKVGVVSPTDSKEADPPPGNDHLITGRVFSRDGSPIENTLVSLPGRPLRDFDERSDAAGAFSIELDREGFEDLLFAAEGYGTARRVSVPTGTRNLEIRLVPASSDRSWICQSGSGASCRRSSGLSRWQRRVRSSRRSDHGSLPRARRVFACRGVEEIESTRRRRDDRHGGAFRASRLAPVSLLPTSFRSRRTRDSVSDDATRRLRSDRARVDDPARRAGRRATRRRRGQAAR